MKSTRAVARQTLAAENSAQRIEQLHELVGSLAEQLSAVQGQLEQLLALATTPATPEPAAKPGK